MKPIAEIIKYEGDNNIFIWKHPCEDFNSLTQLIVHESQEAIFFMNGQALDLFGPGRYTLETQNIPFIGKALHRATGDRTPFHCEVYFINQTVQMGLKWGTPEPVRFITPPPLEVSLAIGASGTMNLKVSNSRKLLVKLVGTMRGVSWDLQGDGLTKSLAHSFRPLITTAIKTHLAKTIRSENIDVVEIDGHLERLSEVLRQRILPGFEEYGLTIPEFYVTNVALPETDSNFKRLRELHTIALQTRMAEADAEVKSAYARAQADIVSARRGALIQEQITATEIARHEQERELIAAQTRANVKRLEGFADADVMARQGVTQKDYLQAEVQKEYARGIGSMGAGGAGGTGVMSDILGIGIGMAAAGQILPQMNGMLQNAYAAPAAASVPTKDELEADESLQCPNCGKSLSAGVKFCSECGSKIEVLAENEIICPGCGKKTVKGKFCSECGMPLVRKCTGCGAELSNTAKFCSACGQQV